MFRCGECCAHPGFVYTIQEDYGDYRFFLHNNYTGEETLVVIGPDKRDIFRDKNYF